MRSILVMLICMFAMFVLASDCSAQCVGGQCFNQQQAYGAYYVYRQPAPIVQAMRGTWRAATYPFRPRYYYVPAPGRFYYRR